MTSDVFPASIAQERVWLAHHLRPSLPVYNVAMWLPVPDGGDVERLAAALTRLVDRHESLRTSFVGDVGVVQVVHPAGPVRVPETDLRSTPPTERDAAFARAARAEATVPFALDRAPLWRARLVRLAGDDARLVFVCHHAVFDGASSDILVRELLEVYAAAGAGREPDLPELPVQCADHAVWQRDRSTPARIAAEQARQDRTLARLPADLGLPTDRPRPPTPTARGEVHPFTVPAELTARIVAWSKRTGVTPFMTMLAAFHVLLARWAGRTDVHVGVPLGGRTLPELTGLIGMFVHTAVVRTDLAADPSFGELTRQVRDAVAATLDHQDVPGRTPQCQVGFNLVPSDISGQIHTGTVMSDLALDLSLAGGTVRGRLEYATDLFEEATARSLADAYVAALAGALDAPDRPVSVLPVTVPERAAGRVEWIDGGPLPAPAAPVTRLIAGHARRRPDRTAIVHDGRTVGYGELHTAALATAARLIRHGAGPDRPVAVALAPGVDAVVAILGALYAGAPYVAVDPHGPAERVRAVLDDADPAVVVALPGEAVAYGDRAVVRPINGADGPDTAATTPATVAYVSYTSGSAGRPKGVVVGAAALAHFVAAATARYGITADDRVLQFAPLHFDASVEELFVTLCAGATLVIRTPAMLESVPRLLSGCADAGVTVLDLPTAYWHEVAYLVGGGATLPAGIRTVIIGGEAAAPARVARWPATVRLINSYGPTEATVVATAADLTPADTDVPIGLPLAGVRAAVIDGELYLAGPTLADGYLNRPDLTARRFVTLDGVRAYRTGDLVRRRADGQLVFVGRRDDELKISGHRVDPAEIESALLDHPSIRDAAVVAVPTATGTVRLVAYIVTAGPVAADLPARLGAVLPAVMIPSTFVAVPAIPRTANNKVDRAALRERDTGPRAVAADGIERVVLDAWTAVLGTAPASVDDDFFDVGGRSLQTIQIANRLAAVLGREITVGTVFEHPTVAGLAHALAGARVPEGHDPALRDAVLPPDIRPGPGPARTAAAARTVLLTGATGFVGRYLLRELLTTTDVRVVCPVRADDPAVAADRITRALTAAGTPDVPGLAARVHPVPADLGRPRFDLDPAAFDRLAADVDAVYHAAANVSLAVGYDSARAANVLATREILRLAATGRPAAVHHVSTVAVAGRTGLRGPGYAHSKEIAERLVTEAGRRGLPVAIYRLGRVVGPGDGTAVNPDDLIWRVLRAAVDLSTLPDLRVAEPWTPVDWVARTLVSLSRTRGAAADAPVATLLPTRPTSLRDVVDWVAGYGFDLPRLPADEWAGVALRHPDHAAVAIPLTAASADVPAVHIGRSGSDCPPVDEALMRRYLATAVATGVLPVPAGRRRAGP
ncbi:non-ribosomal peptide synthetase [Virgisporangium aurantiacum]|uniref:Carrier domain-containing protein n=1 Tax=Virgisporangium aurantiacum TaxID=175570 RepID=A0A8J3Z6X7_9ACTN|nr:non-ribosomal peptide synthetase [Virgisporangium aurantiacum]GIJ56361.1 hypothetical protein Vau01_038770 [Virgisporangium aurantiacum]